ncbi:transposase [Streptomyces venezuelae]|nr:transposase [Streptomyces venezuelae]
MRLSSRTRQVIDAIVFTYRTGTPWMDLPEHFGSWMGVHNRRRPVLTAVRRAPLPAGPGDGPRPACARRRTAGPPTARAPARGSPTG